MISQRKINYLQKIGVTVWQLREKVIPHFFCIELKNNSEKTTGLIVAEIENSDIISEKNQIAFLEKMSGALAEYYFHRIISTEEIFSNNLDFIIFLGEKIPQNLMHSHHAKIIKSTIISKLIHDVEKKRALWQVIKSLKQ